MNELNFGDKIAIVAPCGQIGSIEKIKYGVDYLKQKGFEPILGEHLFAVNRYMAGSDAQRADDINQAYANKEIKAIFCARAAAGGTRILPYIDYDLARRNPKPVIGFCDNVALQLALWQKSGIISYNGMVLSYDFQTPELDSQIAQGLQACLSGEKQHIVSGETLRSGQATGRLLCSNLSVLLRLAGTPYFPDLSGKILLLEDVHERLHKIDLMFQQLKQQPSFNKLKGIIFGQFTNCEGDEEDGSLDDCISDFLQQTNIPAVKNFAFGHTKSRHVLPLGAEAYFDADKTVLEI